VRVVYLADAPYIHEQRWIRHFVASGVDCDVISFRPATIEGARIHYIDGAETLGKARYLIHARRVKRLIQELKPDILHALHLTSYGFLGALSGVQPLVISVFGTDILEAPHLTPFHRWLTRHSLERAAAITATGLHLATETTRYTPRGTPVTVVPYGVDLERFKPRDASSIANPPSAHPEPGRRAVEGRGGAGVANAPSGEAAGFIPQSPLSVNASTKMTTQNAERSEGELILGAASRLSPEKGIHYLIEAFALLRHRYGDRVRLRIAGDTTPQPGGPERQKLEALARERGVADGIEFLGWVPHEALPAFLQDLDIFVLPSVYEGFGVAAAEASAMALPVVASNVYGIPDVVRDGLTGLLTPAKDSPAIAAACSRLIEDEALRLSLGRAGRDYIATNYDWQHNIAQMEQIYRDVLTAPTPTREAPVWT
jgi:glycosyltransferase involved in cell wall biosynthesis